MPDPDTDADSLPVRYVTGRLPGRDAVRALYDAVAWSAYTDDMDALMDGLHGSAAVVTAWCGPHLVGLARVVGDGSTIAYLQDVLVHPDHRRGGIASALVDRAFAPFVDVRQHVLLTDAEPGQRAFYESLRFREVRDLPHGGLRAFVRFQQG